MMTSRYFIFDQSLFIALCLHLFISQVQCQDSLNVKLLFHWNDTTIPGTTWFNNRYNEVWGFAQNGREYAVIGSTLGTHIFDITNPASSYLADFVPGAAQGTGIVHRDFKSYKKYLYMVCDEGASTLQIADVSYLPDSVKKVYDSNALFARSHNIFIDTANAKLYSFGGNNNNGVHAYSLTNPESPTDLKNLTLPELSHDGYAWNDTLYINDGNNKFHVYNFSNPASPVPIGSLTSYPFMGYNHSGWMNETGKLYAMADENHGFHLKLLDVSDVSNITVLSTFWSGVNDTVSIPHNPIIRGNYVYVSYYYDGLYIFNISNPSVPTIAGFYHTSKVPHKKSYEGSWGVNPLLPSGRVLLSDMQEGLFVFDVSGAVSGAEQKTNEKELVVFPNPFNDYINISNPFMKEGTTNYTLYDCTGRVVKNGLLSSSISRMEVGNNISDGIYLLHIFGNNKSFTRKLIKNIR